MFTAAISGIRQEMGTDCTGGVATSWSGVLAKQVDVSPGKSSQYNYVGDYTDAFCVGRS